MLQFARDDNFAAEELWPLSHVVGEERVGMLSALCPSVVTEGAFYGRCNQLCPGHCAFHHPASGQLGFEPCPWSVGRGGRHRCRPQRLPNGRLGRKNEGSRRPLSRPANPRRLDPGAIAVCVIDRKFKKAVGFALAGTVLTFFGFMHGERIGFAQSPVLAFSYAAMAALMMGCARFGAVTSQLGKNLEPRAAVSAPIVSPAPPNG
jgi:hypothetical protein